MGKSKSKFVNSYKLEFLGYNTNKIESLRELCSIVFYEISKIFIVDHKEFHDNNSLKPIFTFVEINEKGIDFFVNIYSDILNESFLKSYNRLKDSEYKLYNNIYILKEISVLYSYNIQNIFDLAPRGKYTIKSITPVVIESQNNNLEIIQILKTLRRKIHYFTDIKIESDLEDPKLIKVISSKINLLRSYNKKMIILDMNIEISDKQIAGLLNLGKLIGLGGKTTMGFGRCKIFTYK